MEKNLVRDWMTQRPVTVEPETALAQAHQLLKEYNIRRLPVVENGAVVGIITLGDVREAGPTDISSLSMYELDYMLLKLTIGDIMTRDPIMVNPETTLRDAAKLMLENKIGGLPVVDGDQLVGIITESDIFRALIEALG